MENRYWNDATELTVALLRKSIEKQEWRGQSNAMAHEGTSNQRSRMYPTDESKYKEAQQ